jgi:tripartite-type tricarboxylate transporter receptor subunit TctC
MFSIRIALVLFLALSALASGARAQNPADSYPNRPVRFIVPYTPGSALDVLARDLGQYFLERTGQTMVIDNRPGASQAIALEAAAKAPADGYNLVMGTQSGLVFLTASRKSLPYDPIKDFASITMMIAFPFNVTVHPSLPVQSIAELISLAKAQPGKLFYASIGLGGGHHLVTEWFKSRTGTDMVHVPFKGNAQAQAGLIAGEVQVMFEGPSILPHIRSGKVRAIATTGLVRTRALPDLPTVAEAGLPGFDMAPWFGLSAPAALPRPILDKLNREVVAYLRSPATQKKFAAAGFEFMPGTPEEMNERIRAEIPLASKLMRSVGMEPE